MAVLPRRTRTACYRRACAGSIRRLPHKLSFSWASEMFHSPTSAPRPACQRLGVLCECRGSAAPALICHKAPQTADPLHRASGVRGRGVAFPEECVRRAATTPQRTRLVHYCRNRDFTTRRAPTPPDASYIPDASGPDALYDTVRRVVQCLKQHSAPPPLLSNTLPPPPPLLSNTLPPPFY